MHLTQPPQPGTQEPEWVDLREATKFLPVGRTKFYELLNSGALEGR
ncbi:MAG TPA: hypothetical protein VD994_02750 [Prosthecobacter sp.]|nr:hypothetical protein [Prosthecobacter sp.]